MPWFTVALFAVAAGADLWLGIRGSLLVNSPTLDPWGRPAAVLGVPALALGGFAGGLAGYLAVAALNDEFDRDGTIALLVTSLVTVLLAIVLRVHLVRHRRAPALGGRRRKVQRADLDLSSLALIAGLVGIMCGSTAWMVS